MTRAHSHYRCRDCGSVEARWAGRCGRCGEWNTLMEEPDPGGFARGVPSGGNSSRRLPAPPPVELRAVPDGRSDPVPTGLAELDRVLGGGLVPSSVTLVAGEPGTGKSTLLLQMLAELARRGTTGLLVSAEESPEQVRRRATRMDALPPGLWVAGHTALPEITAAIRELRPGVVVIDSIQTVWDPELDSAPGSVSQVRGCAVQLVDEAKPAGPALVLVGHVTKDGSIAGPRALEHMVDTVLSFDGERHHTLRLVRAVKHRFGPTGELGLLEMTAAGLRPVPDAGSFLLADRQPGVPGSVVFPMLEGRRPLLVEIQALVGATPAAPRRSASGYDPTRLAQLLAVLDRRAGLGLADRDVYVSAVGGVRVADPGADLAVALAVASAATDRPVDGDVVVVGEVGLGGELRQVPQLPRRLAEAARLGFARAVTPPGGLGPTGMDVGSAATVREALDRYLGPPAQAPRLRVVAAGASGG